MLIKSMFNKTLEKYMNVPINCSLKYVDMAACALASSSGSMIDINCVSCASTLAGFNDDTSSIVHSNCVEECCGVLGR